MTGSNHVITGALIATSVTSAPVAIPLALLSHFVLDALPHYGDNNRHSWLNRHFTYVLLIDAVIGIAIVLALILLQPANWVLLVVCGLVAVAPDAIWLPHYLADRRGNYREPSHFARFSKWIQWGERPWGIYIEAAWLIAFGLLLVSRIA